MTAPTPDGNRPLLAWKAAAERFLTGIDPADFGRAGLLHAVWSSVDPSGGSLCLDVCDGTATTGGNVGSAWQVPWGPADEGMILSWLSQAPQRMGGPCAACAHVVGPIGPRIRALREAKGLALAGLAAKSSLSKGYLSELENAASPNPSLDVLRQLARALDVTLADILGEPKTRTTLSIPSQLPPGLQQFVKQRKALGHPLDNQTIAWLGNAPFRGQRPTTAADFALLYRLLRLDDEDAA